MESKGRKNMLSGVLLLAILAFCGFIGTREANEQLVEAAVVSRTVLDDSMQVVQSMDAAQILFAEREKELALLDEIIADEATDSATKSLALNQKLSVTQRIEKEAQATACLKSMGYDDAAVFCGTQIVSVVLSGQHLEDETERIQVIDVVCSQIGVESDAVKIILSKK